MGNIFPSCNTCFTRLGHYASTQRRRQRYLVRGPLIRRQKPSENPQSDAADEYDSNGRYVGPTTSEDIASGGDSSDPHSPSRRQGNPSGDDRRVLAAAARSSLSRRRPSVSPAVLRAMAAAKEEKRRNSGARESDDEVDEEEDVGGGSTEAVLKSKIDRFRTVMQRSVKLGVVGSLHPLNAVRVQLDESGYAIEWAPESRGGVAKPQGSFSVKSIKSVAVSSKNPKTLDVTVQPSASHVTTYSIQFESTSDCLEWENNLGALRQLRIVFSHCRRPLLWAPRVLFYIGYSPTRCLCAVGSDVRLLNLA